MEEQNGTDVSRRRSPRRLVKGVAVLAAVAALLLIVVYSPLFVLERISVDGMTTLKEEDIWRIADIHKGEPLFRLQTDEIKHRLESDLRIEEAAVRRSLPDGLDIHIRERTLVATVAADYGYADLDRTGRIISVHKALVGQRLPLITGGKIQGKYIGDTVEDENVQQMLAFLDLLGADALNQISEITLLRPGYVVAYTTGAVQIRLGAFERIEEKATLTQGFLDDLKVNPYPVEYVDFTYTSPFIKFRQ